MGKKQFWALLFVFGGLVAASRLPLAPGQLFSFDDVNFAYAIGHFDPRISQPQPPGYPLFVWQTRLLDWLRFKRPESNLLALSLMGSTAALVALAWFGNRFMGSDAGLCAAWLLLFHHSFWYSGLTSALRPQLAVISVVVAAACYRAWCGEKRWIYWSALALGVGAGIRPEMGLLLLPLWGVSVWRAGGRWRDWLRAVGLLLAVVLLWLVPTIVASGGPATYFRLCWHYLADQSALTSGLFGAEERRWRRTICWLLVWTLSGLLAWPLPAILARRRGEGFGLGRARIAFLTLWFVPSFLFAISVHIEDPGQALSMVPVVCLAGGHLISRAASRIELWIPRAHGLVFLFFPIVFLVLLHITTPSVVLALVPVGCLIAGNVLSRSRMSAEPWIPRRHALLFLLLPSLFLNGLIFFRPGWYYRGPPATGWKAVAGELWADMHSGLNLSSLSQIRSVLWVDGEALRELRRLAVDRPNKTVVVWERGLTSWRKTAYYFPNLPVVVLDRKTLREPSVPVARKLRGPRVEERWEGPPPVRIPLPAGARLVWMLNPKTDFFQALRQSFPLREAGPLYYHDLPKESGEMPAGNYMLAW